MYIGLVGRLHKAQSHPSTKGRWWANKRYSHSYKLRQHHERSKNPITGLFFFGGERYLYFFLKLARGNQCWGKTKVISKERFEEEEKNP